jgi:hypothetical protein
MLQQDTVRFSTPFHWQLSFYDLFSLSYFGFLSFGCSVSCEYSDLSDTTALFSCKHIDVVTLSRLSI